MRFMLTMRVLLALLVALLLPLEQARCACAAMQRQAASSKITSAAQHPCCAARAAAAAASAAKAGAPSHHCTSQECGCMNASAESAPATTLAPAAESPLFGSLAVVHVFTLIAPITAALPATAALDDGRPPQVDAHGAHGLRAPPATA